MSDGINVLSLCDGMSCGRIALERAGINVNKYFASEIKDIAIKVTMNNYPDTIQVGDVNNINYSDGILHTENGDFDVDIDLVIFGSPCFTKDTLVLTSEGYKSIKDVSVGDYVLAHDNKMHVVTNHMMNGIKQIWQIKCMGAETINTTYNHKFYVRQRKRTWNNAKRAYDVSFDAPEWVETSELNSEYYVGYAINQESKLPEWNGIDYWKQWRIHHINSLDFTDKKFWYIVGRFLGDGWIRKNTKKGKYRINEYNGVIICCGKDEIDELKNKIDGVFHYNIIEERTVYKLHIPNTELAMFLSQFNKGAKNKIVPNFVMDLPVDLLSEFLQGYFDSDGHHDKKHNKQKITTVSRRLAYGIEQCIIKVTHRPCSFIVSERPKKYMIEGREVNQNTVYVVEYNTNKNAKTHGFYEDGYMWLPIRRVTQTNDYEEVYDITVDEAHSFTANGMIVHNCQSFSRAMIKNKKIGLEDKERSGLFLECHRVLKEINPKYFLMENVIMKSEDEKIISDMMGVKPIRINSSLVSAQLRDRYYWTNIPNVVPPQDRGIKLQDILLGGYVPNDKAKCLCKNDSHGYYNGSNWTPIKRFHRFYYKSFGTMIFPSKQYFDNCLKVTERILNGRNSYAKFYDDYVGHDFDCARYLWREERARLQTVPEKYVECLTEQEAADVLGDGWTVDVVAHIFSFLPY